MKRWILLVLGLLFAMTLIGCNAETFNTTSESTEAAIPEETPMMDGGGFSDDLAMYEEMGMETEMTGDALPEEIENTPATDGIDSDRMIIKNADLSLETNHYDDSLASIRTRITELGGEITHSEQYGSAEAVDRYTSLTIRVPAAQYETLLQGVSSFGEVTWMSESTEDVTTQYIDLAARIESLEAQEQRLLELVEQATSVTEIMEIEYQLSNVRYERESYTQQQLYLERQVSMSTIYLSLQEREQVIITQTNFLTDVAGSFINGAQFLGDAAAALTLVFAAILPALLVLVVVVVLILLIVRAVVKKKK